MRFPFVGGSYESRSLSADAQRAMNVYPEGIESGTGKNAASMYTRPGLSLFCQPNPGPGRGLWPGENRLFAASGSRLIEIKANGSFTDRGDIANDTNPVAILPNGDQLGIVSAGKFYCDSGLGPELSVFNLQTGVVDTSGTTVTFVSGDLFQNAGPNGTNNAVAGEQIKIGSTVYVIQSVDSPTQITLTGSAGTQTAVAYTVYFLVGLVNTAGVAVTWVSGDLFDPAMAGGSIIINGVTYTVSSVTDTKHLILTSTAGTQTLSRFSANPIVTASSGAFLDGYFVVADSFSSKKWHISALDDGRIWDEADFALKEAYPDNIMAILADHEEIYLWGDEQTTEVWRDTGAANFPFERDPSAFMHYCSIAPYAGVRLDEGVAWIAGDIQRGVVMAVYAKGYQPVRISTHAIEQKWGSYSKISDAVAYSKMENGHHLWVINFPTANATWVWDQTEHQWHERGWWNGTGWNLQRAWFHAYVDLGNGPKHFVQDGINGNIYIESTTYSDDNGTAIMWRRTCPYIQESEEQHNLTFHRFELDAAAGLQKAKLSWSDDRGANYTSQKSPRPPVKTRNGYRYNWPKLGAGRYRIFQLDGQGPASLINGRVRATAGGN